jgi:S1-C subfamily serine protease
MMRKKLVYIIKGLLLTVALAAIPVVCAISISKTSETVELNRQSTLVEMVPKVMPSVVHIRNNTQDWEGSGVAISEDIILTARHVVEGGDNFTITLPSGEVVDALIAISSHKYDIGFIKIVHTTWPCGTPILTPAILGGLDECKLGQPVFCIGGSLGEMNFPNLTLGVISSLKRDLEKYGCPEDYGWSITWQIDAATYGGNSGGPVFDMSGVVRGLVVGGYRDYESISYCVPVDLILKDLDEINLLFVFNKYYKEVAEDFQEYY